MKKVVFEINEDVHFAQNYMVNITRFYNLRNSFKTLNLSDSLREDLVFNSRSEQLDYKDLTN